MSTATAHVSVVIPTHRRDDLLPDAVASALRQTLPPLEVIVCDDTGSPGTEALVAALGEDAGGVPVRYVDSSAPGHGTAGSSRNVGARLATGDLLAFLDDDDMWEPDHLESLHAVLLDEHADVAVGWTRSDDPGFVFARIRPGLTARQVVSVNPGFVGSNFLITAEAFAAVGGFDPTLRVSNDQDLLVRLLAAGRTYAVVPRFTVLNRIHDAGQLTDKTEARVRALRAYAAKHAHLMTTVDRLVIGTVVAGIRRVVAPTLPRRAWWTALTAAGRAALLVARPGR